MENGGDIIEQFVAFVCNFWCAVALFGSSENIGPEMQEKGTTSHKVAPENKAPAVIGCPMARYTVRLGRDGDANLIDLSVFTDTTIQTMRSWPSPSIIPPANRISPYETTVLALEATLVEYDQERTLEGSDYRLVLADESGRTIIVRVASPECAAQDDGEPGSELPRSRFIVGLELARAEVAARLSPTTTVQSANVHVRVMGIGMFDSLSGQAGEAPNGIELSPVLDIEFGQERMPVVPVPRRHHPRSE